MLAYVIHEWCEPLLGLAYKNLQCTSYNGSFPFFCCQLDAKWWRRTEPQDGKNLHQWNTTSRKTAGRASRKRDWALNFYCVKWLRFGVYQLQWWNTTWCYFPLLIELHTLLMQKQTLQLPLVSGEISTLEPSLLLLGKGLPTRATPPPEPLQRF